MNWKLQLCVNLFGATTENESKIILASVSIGGKHSIRWPCCKLLASVHVGWCVKWREYERSDSKVENKYANEWRMPMEIYENIIISNS